MVEFSYKNEGCRMIVLRCIGPSNFFRKSFIPNRYSYFYGPKRFKS